MSFSSPSSAPAPSHLRSRLRAPLPAAAGLVALGLLLAALPAAATEVEIFQLQSQKAFLAGTLDGVAVDGDGRLTLAERVEEVARLDVPLALSAAAHPEGWVVGTGSDGEVFLVRRSGAVERLLDAEEDQVFAVWADPDGTVFAGTSPGGKIYRIPPGGEGALYHDTGEVYVWALARAADGALLAATGTSGKLLRLTGEAGSVQASVLQDTDDVHVRSLEVLEDGRLVLGTAGEGRILRRSSARADAEVRTLHDADQPEVVALESGADGVLWAAVIASEASSVDLSGASSASGGASGGTASGGSSAASSGTGGRASVSVAAGAVSAGSRSASFSGKRSQLLEISPDGVVETVWGSDDETVFDLHWDGRRLWVATGLEGKVYAWDGERMVLEKDLEDRQVVALAARDADRPALLTTNGAALYRVAEGLETEGTYVSGSLDAGQVARFGTLSWRGEVPASAQVRFAARSGVAAEPDATWSPWVELEPLGGAATAGANGGELSLARVPAGRYLQLRGELERPASGPGPALVVLEASYRQANQRPAIESFRALDPGEILVPAGFNPGLQVYEPASPDRDGIFNSIEEADASGNDPRVKTVWKLGWRTLQWEVEDPNDDDLGYDLHFQGVGGGPWRPMAEELTEDHYSFDARVLPDGLYRFRLRASDADANPPEEGLVAERLSEPVVVDHTPPRLVSARGQGSGLRVVLEDALSPLAEVEVSRNAGAWEAVSPVDAMLDGRREELQLATGEGTELLLLRVRDASHNLVTFDLSGQVSP